MAKKQPGEGPYFNNPDDLAIRHSRKIDSSGNPVEPKRQLSDDKIFNDGDGRMGPLPRDGR